MAGQQHQDSKIGTLTRRVGFQVAALLSPAALLSRAVVSVACGAFRSRRPFGRSPAALGRRPLEIERAGPDRLGGEVDERS